MSFVKLDPKRFKRSLKAEKTESQFAGEVLLKLNAISGCYAWKVHMGAYGISGVADILCCLKGKFVAIELKRPGKYEDVNEGLTENQKAFGSRVRRAGGMYIVADSWETISETLDV
jgi:hypothetical protein